MKGKEGRNKMELLRLLAAGGAGCVIGFCIGYLIGSDNGFTKAASLYFVQSNRK